MPQDVLARAVAILLCELGKTQEEANSLRAETNKNIAVVLKASSGMPANIEELIQNEVADATMRSQALPPMPWANPALKGMKRISFKKPKRCKVESAVSNEVSDVVVIDLTEDLTDPTEESEGLAVGDPATNPDEIDVPSVGNEIKESSNDKNNAQMQMDHVSRSVEKKRLKRTRNVQS